MTYKIALLVASLLGVAFGLPMFIWLGEWVASIFLCLGCCGFLVLPSLAPAFMSAVAALSAKGKALVSICTAILNGLRYLPA